MKKPAGSIVIVLLLLLAVMTFSGCFEDERRPSDSEHAAIVGDSEGNVHIVWEDNRDGNWEIYYTKLNSLGENLIDDVRITDNESYSREPAIAIDSRDNVHLVWYDGRDGNMEIYYAVLDINGERISDNIRLVSDVSDSYDPAIAVDSDDNIHIAWTDWMDGSASILYSQLDEDGNILMSFNVTTDEWHSYDASIVVDTDDAVHVMWYDERITSGFLSSSTSSEISYVKLSNHGQRLMENTVLTPLDRLESTSPSMTLDHDNNVNFAWQDTQNGFNEIMWAILDQESVDLTDNHDGYTTNRPLLQDSENEYYFELEDYFSDGQWSVSGDVYSENTAVTLGDVFISYNRETEVQIGSWTSSDVSSADPENPDQVFFDVTEYVTANGNYTIKWDCTGGEDLYILATRLLSEPLLTEPTSVSETSVESFEPAIAVDSGGNSHIVWYEEVEPDNTELFYSQFDSTGNRVVQIIQLTDAPLDSFDPNIYLDSDDGLHIVWVDRRGGESAIYYMKLDDNGNTIVSDTRLTPLNDGGSGDNNGGGGFTFGFDVSGIFLIFIIFLLVIIMVFVAALFFIVYRRKGNKK
jgi:hypothetical protein